MFSTKKGGARVAEMANFLELERLALPSLSLIISFLSGVLLIVGLATPGWVKVSIDSIIYIYI